MTYNIAVQMGKRSLSFPTLKHFYIILFCEFPWLLCNSNLFRVANFYKVTNMYGFILHCSMNADIVCHVYLVILL